MTGSYIRYTSPKGCPLGPWNVIEGGLGEVLAEDLPEREANGDHHGSESYRRHTVAVVLAQKQEG